MADIQVFFPRRGNGKGSDQAKVIVLNERQVIWDTESVHWHFQVEQSEEIDLVEIEFEDPSAMYFLEEDAVRPGRKQTNKCARLLADGDTIYGRPPERTCLASSALEKGPIHQMYGYRDKYSIKGYKKVVGDHEETWEEVACLDPEIVPIRPPA